LGCYQNAVSGVVVVGVRGWSSPSLPQTSETNLQSHTSLKTRQQETDKRNHFTGLLPHSPPSQLDSSKLAKQKAQLNQNIARQFTAPLPLARPQSFTQDVLHLGVSHSVTSHQHPQAARSLGKKCRSPWLVSDANARATPKPRDPLES
jgi:hypothetical protein